MEAFIKVFLAIFLVETRKNSPKEFVKKSMGAFLNECLEKFLEESLVEFLKHLCGESVRVFEAIHARFLNESFEKWWSNTLWHFPKKILKKVYKLIIERYYESICIEFFF